MKKMTNEQLCVLAQKGDVQAQEQLVRNNLGYIRKTANELYISNNLENSELGIERSKQFYGNIIGVLNTNIENEVDYINNIEINYN